MFTTMKMTEDGSYEIYDKGQLVAALSSKPVHGDQVVAVIPPGLVYPVIYKPMIKPGESLDILQEALRELFGGDDHYCRAGLLSLGIPATSADKATVHIGGVLWAYMYRTPEDDPAVADNMRQVIPVSEGYLHTEYLDVELLQAIHRRKEGRPICYH